MERERKREQGKGVGHSVRECWTKEKEGQEANVFKLAERVEDRLDLTDRQVLDALQRRTGE